MEFLAEAVAHIRQDDFSIFVSATGSRAFKKKWQHHKVLVLD